MELKTLYVIGLLILLSTACKDDINKTDAYKIVTIDSDWFEVNYINPKTYSIEEPASSQGNVSYLILGDSKAIMFDTGSGENEAINGFKIKPIINQLTELPISLLLSHFHFDHNQNIAEFDNISFPDLPFLRQSISDNDIYHFTAEDLFIGDYPSQAQISEWLPVNTDIDLGNRIIELVSIPGHTNESVAIIDKTNKLAFLGDYLYNGTLFLFDNNDLITYKESVDYLISTLSSDFKLYGAHGTPQVQYENLEKLKNFLICIENDNCQSTASNVWGYDVLIYKYESMQILIFQ